MRLLPLVLLIALAAVPNVRAEVTWISAGDRYELTGAMLFGLRDELPDDLEEKLKAIRNRTFDDEIAFGTALEALDVPNDWVVRFLDVARVRGGNFGIEARGEGMTTLYCTDVFQGKIKHVTCSDHTFPYMMR